MDKRIVKSTTKLTTALVSLLQEYQIDDINISMLCKQAHVNRNTFYSHYSNLTEFVEVLYKQGEDIFDKYVTEYIFLSDSENILRETCKCFKDEELIKAIILSHELSKPFVERLMVKYFSKSNEYAINNLQINDYEKFKMISSFLEGAIVFLLDNWCENGMKEDVEAIVEKIMYPTRILINDCTKK